MKSLPSLIKLACVSVSLFLAGSALAQSGFLPGEGRSGGGGASGSWGDPVEYEGPRNDNGMPVDLPQGPDDANYVVAGVAALGTGFGAAIDAGALTYGPEISQFLAGGFTGLTGDSSINIGVVAISSWGFWGELSGNILGRSIMLLVDENGDELIVPDFNSDEWGWALFEPGSGYYDYYGGSY